MIDIGRKSADIKAEAGCHPETDETACPSEDLSRFCSSNRVSILESTYVQWDLQREVAPLFVVLHRI